MFMSKSFKMDTSLMSLSVVTSLTCMQNVGALRMHGNVVSCNAMLGGCAMHGLAGEAAEFFKWMCEEGVELDRVTFISLL